MEGFCWWLLGVLEGLDSWGYMGCCSGRDVRDLCLVESVKSVVE